MPCYRSTIWATCRRSILLAVTLSGLSLLLLAAASPAHASAASFSCRASAERISVPGVLSSEPIVANSGDSPCQTDGPNSAANFTAPSNSTLSLTTDALSASTKSTNNSASATADVAMPNLGLLNSDPVLGNSLTLSANTLSATASYTCVDGQPTAGGGSTVEDLTTGGSLGISTDLSSPSATETIALPGGLGTLYINQTVQTATSITHRAIYLKLASGATIAIGEAVADISGNPCSSATNNNSNTPTPIKLSTGLPGAGDVLGISGSFGDAHLVTHPGSVLGTVAKFGVTKCVRANFEAQVKGVDIKNVLFLLDGRSLGTDRHAPFEIAIHARAGAVNTLKAKVHFTDSTKTRTLKLRFRTCLAPGSRQTPLFTG